MQRYIISKVIFIIATFNITITITTTTLINPTTTIITADTIIIIGRGLADQIRWMLAASEISFTQRIVDSRKKFLKMKERQLPFGQLPLLQIDGLEIVQSQSIVRYLARRANLTGQNSEVSNTVNPKTNTNTNTNSIF